MSLVLSLSNCRQVLCTIQYDFDDRVKDGCQVTGISRLTKNSRPPNLVDGMFGVWWRLRKFSWVKKIVVLKMASC